MGRLMTMAATLLCSIGGMAHVSERVEIPVGGAVPVMVDGLIGEEEWRDAKQIAIADSVRLYVKQVGDHVFVAVRMDTPTPRPVDIFLIPASGELHQLHASMATGERLLPGTPWPEDLPWRWHRHPDWTANDAELDPAKAAELPWSQRLVPADGVEFQIRRSRFQGTQWRVRIEVGNFPGATGSFVFPRESKREDTETWALFVLE